MASENLQIDENGRNVLGAVTNDASEFIKNLRVNPATGRLLVDANVTSTNTSIGSTIPGGTAGSILFLGAGSTLAEDNANLFYDDTSNYVGFGNNTPTATLHITGTFRYQDGSETAGYVLSTDNNGNATWVPGATITGGYNLIQNQGVSVLQRTTINLTNLLTATDVGGKTQLDINIANLAANTTFQSDFIAGLEANLTLWNSFLNDIATNANFISDLTGDVTFQGDIVSIINSSGSSLTIDLSTQVGSSVLPLVNGGTGSALVDPNYDAIMGWDDTDNSVSFWHVGTNLTYDHATHTLNASGGGSGITSINTDATAAQTLSDAVGGYIDIVDDGIGGHTFGVNIAGLTSDPTFQSDVNSFVTGSGGGGTKLAIDTTETLVSGTTTPTVVYTIPIPGGILGTNDAIRYQMLFNTFGIHANEATNITVTYGGSVVGNINVNSPGTDRDVPLALLGYIVANGVTNAQKSQLNTHWGDEGFNQAGLNSYQGIAVDSTISQNLVVTITLNSTNGANAVRSEAIIVEKISTGSGSNKKVGVGDTTDVTWFNTQYTFGNLLSDAFWTLTSASPEGSFASAGGTNWRVRTSRGLPFLNDPAGTLFFNSGKQTIFQTQIRTKGTNVNENLGGVGFDILGSSVPNSLAGNQGTNAVSVGFVRKDSDGTWYTRAADGAAFTENLITLADDTAFTVRCEYDPLNTEARFYVDGVLVDTITTNLPTAVASVVGFTAGNGAGANDEAITLVSSVSFAVEI